MKRAFPPICILVATFVAILYMGSLARAQQPSPAEQALSERLLAEIQANVQARAQLIDVQRQLTAAQAKIKELEPKPTAEVQPNK